MLDIIENMIENMINRPAHQFLRRCNQILDIIPKDYPSRDDLLNAIGHLCTDAFYYAPEIQGQYWKKLCDILTIYLPPPGETDWSINITQVLNHKKDPEPSTNWISFS